MPTNSIAAMALGLAAAFSSTVSARAAELRVLAGGATTAVMGELVPHFERATGHKLAVQFAGTPELIKLATSAPFDLGFVPVDVNGELEAGDALE